MRCVIGPCVAMIFPVSYYTQHRRMCMYICRQAHCLCTVRYTGWWKGHVLSTFYKCVFKTRSNLLITNINHLLLIVLAVYWNHTI